MGLNLHPEAIKNFDEKADSLLANLIPHPSPPRRRYQVPVEPEIHVSATFSDDNIIGEIEENWFITDRNGDEVGKFFEHEGEFTGLFGEGYKNLVRLSEGMQKARELRNIVSSRLITELIFRWIQEKAVNQIPLPMTEYV
jgi:hypothetical protein